MWLVVLFVAIHCSHVIVFRFYSTGKSTVAALLLRLYDPTSGQITLDGERIDEVNATWLRRNVFALVEQEPRLFKGTSCVLRCFLRLACRVSHQMPTRRCCFCTVRENIRFGSPHATDAQIEEAAKRAYAYDFIMKMVRTQLYLFLFFNSAWRLIILIVFGLFAVLAVV